MPTDLGKTYEFKCFVPLEAKDISELALFNDPVEGAFIKMKSSINMMPKEVIFAPPATIVYWQDGSRTVVKCSEEDEFSEEMGFVLCFMKKMFGNNGSYNNYINDALESAKRYYPKVSSEVPGYIQQIKNGIDDALKAKDDINDVIKLRRRNLDDLLKFFAMGLSSKEEKCDE